MNQEIVIKRRRSEMLIEIAKNSTKIHSLAVKALWDLDREKFMDEAINKIIKLTEEIEKQYTTNWN